MSDIFIEKPFKMELNIVETDNNIPSLKLDCKLNDNGFKGTYDISFNFWVSCEDWDNFANGKINILPDLDGNTFLKIVENEDFFSIIAELSFKFFNTTFSSKIEGNVNQEDIMDLKRKFKDFPKWW